MSKNWAICIGINRYYNLQPLQYAVKDAASVRDFFLNEIKFEQVYYFADDSPPIITPRGEMRSRPTYANLKRFFREWFQSVPLSVGDNFWFFFAGHGELHEDHDYLLPIDVDPGDIPGTALRVSDIADSLRNCGADNTVLLVDACRDRGRRRSQGFGVEAQKGTITIYSCSPNQSSYEIDALQHGAFSYALLEGLRLQGANNCATVERLDQYLCARVPALNERYGKPSQMPRTSVEPISKKSLILIPQQATWKQDVIELKNSAYRAERDDDLDLAQQLWVRVLGASPADQDAVKAIGHIAVRQNQQTTSLSLTLATARIHRTAASCVTIVSGNNKNPEKPLVLLDLETATQWGCRPEEIDVYEGETLATIDFDRIEGLQLQWPNVNFVTPSNLLLPELKFIDHMTEAIPGGFTPESQGYFILLVLLILPLLQANEGFENHVEEGVLTWVLTNLVRMKQPWSEPIVFEGETITPLLPISLALFNYFTPEELMARMRFRSINGGDSLQVEVSLDLPLTGIEGLATPQNYRLTKNYQLKSENALEGVPVLELWPNIQRKGWKAYYGFFFDAGLGRDTFRVRFPDSAETENFRDSQGGNYSLTRMEKFPSVIECLDEANQLIGLILPKPPPEVLAESTWKVGVAFERSFTNISVKRGDSVEPFPINNEGLLVKVIDSPLDTRFTTLLEYFVPESFFPSEKPLPLMNMLTTRGSSSSPKIGNRAILDGRIYIPDVNIAPRADWIDTDLWNNPDAKHLFIKHLILHISAKATQQGVKEIYWLLSYPCTFSQYERREYKKLWIELLRESSFETGMNHICSANLQYFRPKNVALAQYFADREKLDVSNSTCIEIGESISDISIWQDNALLHRCSLKFAERELFSNFLSLNPAFIPKYFGGEASEWVSLGIDAFYRKLDVLLKWEGETWLNEKRALVSDAEDMQGLVRLMALGIGGIYYYIGLTLRALRAQGTYPRDIGTPVYLGGNGSRLLHWLETSGQFTRHSEVSLLLSRLLIRGADVGDTEEETWSSSRPKDEVVFGLLLDYTKLKGMDENSQNCLIPGETYVANEIMHSWDQPMLVEDNGSLRIPNLDNLNMFLYEFHKALISLEIEGIKPLPDYVLSTELSDNTKLWQGIRLQLDRILQEDSNQIQTEPPFILGMKALLQFLGAEWAGR